MKRIVKLSVLVLTLFLLFSPIVYAVVQVIDKYPESNYVTNDGIEVLHPSAVGGHSARGQVFTSNDTHVIGAAQFYIRKYNTPTRGLVAKLYKTTGTVGVNATSTGSALAASDTLPMANVTTSFKLHTFNFTGVNQITLNNSQNYALVIESTGAGNLDGFHLIVVGEGTTHYGNAVDYSNSAWDDNSGSDNIFYFYTSDTPEHLQFDSTTIERNDYELFNVTVRDLDGTSDLKTVDMQINTTGDAENFTLRWTQATNTFSELQDQDNICTLNATSSTRTLVNASTTLLCFNFTMTGGSSGYCDVQLNTTDDTNQIAISTYSNSFSYSHFNWNDAVFDLINSAFSFWGLSDALSDLQTYVSGVATYFTTSLSNMLLLIIQQFRIITNVFTWYIRWFTRFADFFITFGGYIVKILNGTQSGFDDFWTIVDFDSWYEAVPVLLFVFWYDSAYKRGQTQGEINVVMGDLQMVLNITGYFTQMFSMVINIVVDYTFRLFEAIV